MSKTCFGKLVDLKLWLMVLTLELQIEDKQRTNSFLSGHSLTSWCVVLLYIMSDLITLRSALVFSQILKLSTFSNLSIFSQQALLPTAHSSAAARTVHIPHTVSGALLQMLVDINRYAASYIATTCTITSEPIPYLKMEVNRNDYEKFTSMFVHTGTVRLGNVDISMSVHARSLWGRGFQYLTNLKVNLWMIILIFCPEAFLHYYFLP